MTRNDIKALFPDATKEAIDQLLDINSTDIGKAVNKQQGAQDQLESQVKDLNEKIGKLNDQVKSMTSELAEKNNTIKTLTDAKDSAVKDLNAKYEVDTKALNDKYEADTKALNDQLKAAQDKAVVADTLSEQIAKLQKEVADRDATIATNNKNYRIMDGLRNRHARNVDVVFKMLDRDKITEKDGKLEGFDDQVDALEKSDGYLFDADTKQRGGFPGAQDTGGSVNSNSAMNDAIRAAAGRTVV